MRKFIKGRTFALLLVALAVPLSGCKATVKDGRITYHITIEQLPASGSATPSSPTTTASATPTEETSEPEEPSQDDENTTPSEDETTKVPVPDGLNLKPVAEEGLQDILNATGFTGTVLGREARPNNPTSDHPKGLAVDLMTNDDEELGDKIADYVRQEADRLKVKYVLWRVKDHYDHVHVSFEDD